MLLVPILLVGAGLRLARSGYDVLSFDEQWHIGLSTGRGSVHETLPWDVVVESAPPTGTLRNAPPWYRIWTSLGEAVHPPLYFIVLRIWREVLGDGEAVARLLSIFFSLGTIGVIFEAGRRTVGLWPALGAALLFSVAPNQIYIAQQVRGYAMLQCMGVATLLFAIVYERSTSPRFSAAALLGLAALGMMLTHYFALGGAMAIGAYLMVRLRGRSRWGAAVALSIAAVLYCVVWLPQAMPQLRYARIAGEWLGDDRGTIAQASTVSRVLTAPWRQIASARPGYIDRNPPLTEPWAYIGGLLFVLPLLLLRRRPGVLIWHLWLVGTIGFLMALDLARATTHLRFTRYISLAAPGVFVLTSVLLASAPRWLGRALFVLLVIVGLGLNPGIYQREEADWSQIGKILDEHARPGEAIVTYQGTVPRRSFAGYYYLAAALYSDAFPRPVLKLSAPATGELVNQLPGQTAWLITTPVEPRPEDVLPGIMVIEQFTVPRLVTCTRVALPGRRSTTAPLQTGLSAP